MKNSWTKLLTTASFVPLRDRFRTKNMGKIRRVLTIIGARPQFIKAAPVSRALRETGRFREILVHTGQHYDKNMSDVFFREMGIPKPDYNLGVGSGGHGAQTARMLEQLEKVILREKPDCVLIYGDTNSTLAGALAAVKLHVPVAHVEAGLRSFNRKMPEEINRTVADSCSALLFAPTHAAKINLLAEGVSGRKIKLTGDVMQDAALFFARKAQASSHILTTLRLSPKQYILATIHRAENTDDPKRLKSIFKALETASRTLPVVLPLHPRTKGYMKKLGILARNLIITEPVGYLDMIMLENNAAVIATDSGGVQKEAFFYQVPCVTMRDETEWVELVKLGWNRIAKPGDGQRLAKTILSAIGSRGKAGAKPYGNGNASAKIAAALLRLGAAL